jgi:transposase InsO family protein
MGAVAETPLTVTLLPKGQVGGGELHAMQVSAPRPAALHRLLSKRSTRWSHAHPGSSWPVASIEPRVVVSTFDGVIPLRST